MTLTMTERPSAEDSDSPAMLNVKPRPFPLSSSQLEIIDGTPDLGVTSYWTDAEGNVVFSPNTPEEKMRTPVTKTQKRQSEKRGELYRQCLRFDCIFLVFRMFEMWTKRCARLAESLARTSTVQEAEESRRQEGQEEKPGAAETEKQEDGAEETAEQEFSPNQSESTEEHGNIQES